MSELEEYVRKDIIPRYAGFDPAHREDHALIVISQAMVLLDGMKSWVDSHPDCAEIWKSDVDRSMLFAAAACHDLGLANGRENHHMDSGKMIRNDERLREWFTSEQIEIIAQAAEDHRASGKTPPRSIYGMLVAEADRVIDSETIIRRTIQFGFKNYPELDREGHIERAVSHLREKYGRGGYLKLWIPWSDNATHLAELQDIIADDAAVRFAVRRIFESVLYGCIWMSEEFEKLSSH